MQPGGPERHAAAQPHQQDHPLPPLVQQQRHVREHPGCLRLARVARGYHHAVYPHVDLDARFDPVLARHNPEPAYMREPVAGVVNVMQAPWFDPATYRSDSNQHWRSGHPGAELRAGSFPWLQLLVHPEIWAFAGDRMGETMRAIPGAW